MEINRFSNFECWVRQNSPDLGAGKGLCVSDPNINEIKCLQRMMEQGRIYYSKVFDDKLHIQILECFNVKS